MGNIHPGDKVPFDGRTKLLENDQMMPQLCGSSARHTSAVRVPTWLIGILGFLLTSIVVINTFIIDQFQISHLFNGTAMSDDIVSERPREAITKNLGYLVHNDGCRIPDLDPFNRLSQRYMNKEKPIECEFGKRAPLVESNETAIFINGEAIDLYYNDSRTPECCWRSFVRKPNNDNAVKFMDQCIGFRDSAEIFSEFIKVECSQDGKQIYRDYHAFLPRKPKTEARCRKAGNGNPDRLSVLIVGLDSVSRLNLHRLMPKTIKALDELQSIELKGYNKVGDNTYPNLVPVLTGLSEQKLKENCWRDKDKPFDDCPFLWKNFSKAGYRTIFGEDACFMTTFNYLKPGFREPPTDYYLRPYCVAAEGDIGNTRKLNSKLCLGTRKNFENLLQYTSKVAKQFENDRYFAFIWQSSLTHDFVNYPQLGDEAYSEFLAYLQAENLLNNTALILMSDHGMRWGEFRQTYQGRMEGSLPFVFIVLPAWWRNKYSVAAGNLRRNTASLTTPYDLHETLLDILHPENLYKDRVEARNLALNSDNATLGISWFLTIPNVRTCSRAGIPEHWCMCHESINVTLDDPIVQNTTAFFVKELNKLVGNYPQCSVLKLKKLMDAKLWNGYAKDHKDNIAPWTDYTVTLQTEPGDAIFEASIRHRHNDTNNELVGSISRLNAYGKQSACVDDYNMRLYCYCG